MPQPQNVQIDPNDPGTIIPLDAKYSFTFTNVGGVAELTGIDQQVCVGSEILPLDAKRGVRFIKVDGYAVIVGGANGLLAEPVTQPSGIPQTVKIVSAETGLGYMIINEADFDASTMTLYTE